jgi:hypothetical protein
LAQWGGLDSPHVTLTTSKDTTYWVDALTGAVTTVTTPGVNRVKFVFEHPRGVGGMVKLPQAAIAAQSSKASDSGNQSFGTYSAVVGAVAFGSMVVAASRWWVGRRRQEG